jgi:glycosyltransferase involved in cell wall biosynthesis
MSTGLMIAVTDLPSNAEWISAGEGGWLFPDGDVDALAAVMLKAEAMRKDQIAGMTRRNLSIIAERADWKTNATALSEFCLQIALGAQRDCL